MKIISFKSSKQIIHYLVNSAGRNANFLLNIGQMPNGKIQPEFTDTMAIVGTWIKKNGQSIYGTRGSSLPTQPWGVVTKKGKHFLCTCDEYAVRALCFYPGFNGIN